MEEPPFATAPGLSTTGDHLPRLIRGLPDGEVEGLLALLVVRAEVWIPRDDPPFTINPRHPWILDCAFHLDETEIFSTLL
jgi:hypothetical protein